MYTVHTDKKLFTGLETSSPYEFLQKLLIICCFSIRIFVTRWRRQNKKCKEEKKKFFRIKAGLFL